MSLFLFSGKELLQQLEQLLREADESNELLVETNNKLKNKVIELEELLNYAISDMEATARELTSHISTITESTVQHSRASELHSVTEANINEAETQLHATIQRFTQRDVEANDLNEKVNILEGQIKLNGQQVGEASTVAETRKLELEEILSKLKNVESIEEGLQIRSGHFERENGGLAETNLKLTQDLAMYETKLSDLQTKHSATLVEKDETVEQLHSSKNAKEDLTQQLTAEVQGLQSETVVEENNLLNEAHQNAKIELQSEISQLEEQLKQKKVTEDALKSEIEKLKAEAADKTVLETRSDELDELLVTVENPLTEELLLQESTTKLQKKQLEEATEDALKSEIEKLKAETADKSVLETPSEELEELLVTVENPLTEEVENVKSAEAGKEQN